MIESELRLLLRGCKNPPETFLARLFGGLAERGVEVTLVSRFPKANQHHGLTIPWIWSPRSEGGVLARGAKLATVTTAATGFSPRSNSGRRS